jgi:ABC-type nitrate/sulfonate/bicarbonate transport system substrate-binding protein
MNFKNFIRSAIGIATAALLSVGLMTGCSNDDKSSTATNTASNDKVVVKIGTFGTCAWNYPIIVAKEYGIWDEIFKDENVELQLTTSFTTGPEANEALTAGSLDVIWGIGDQPILTGVQNGVDTSILAKVSSQDETIAIVASGKNDDVNSVSDLKGKKIAVAVGTITHKSLIGVLKDNNVDVNDVELVNFSTAGDVVAAIERGDVDAYIGYIFDINNSIKDGTLKKIGDATDNPSSTYIVASNSFVNQYPDIAEKLVQASVEGAQYIKDNPEETYQFIADGTGWSLEDLEELYPLIHTDVEFTDDDLAQLKNTQQFLIDNDILEGELENFETEHINTTFIDKVKAGN